MVAGHESLSLVKLPSKTLNAPFEIDKVINKIQQRDETPDMSESSSPCSSSDDDEHEQKNKETDERVRQPSGGKGKEVSIKREKLLSYRPKDVKLSPK